jgi:RimK family alpha-L-glutamate ligase
MKHLLIIRNDPNDTSSFKFIERGAKLGIVVDIVRYQDFEISFNSNTIRIDLPISNTSFFDYDAFLIHQNLRSADYVKNTLLSLAPDTMRIINGKAFQATFGDVNKLTQLCTLAAAGFPVFLTHFRPSETTIRAFFSRFNTAIVKPIRGSKGQGISEVDEGSTLELFKNTSYAKENLLQEISHSSHDFRILVIDGSSVGVMKREKPESNTFVTTNYSSGGIVSAHEADSELIDLAEKAASFLNLEYCGVDIMQHNGEYKILEVNTAAQFDGFEQALNIDIASQLLKLIIT